MRSSCQYHILQISLNIDFTGIHTVGILFSIKFYEKRPQYEISMTIFQNSTFNGSLRTPCIGRGASSMWKFSSTSLPLSTSTNLLLHTNIRATYLLHSHLLKYECNFAGGGGHSLLWLEATTFLNYIDIYLIDHLLKYGWKFAGGGGNSLL